MKPLLDQFTKPSEAAGIKIRFLPDNAYEVSLCVLSYKKGVVSIVKTVEKVPLKELASQIKKHTPVVVTLEGRGILHKRTELAEGASKVAMLNEVIPNAKSADFYVQQYAAGDLRHVSLIRRQSLDDILGQLAEQGMSVVAVHLGPFVATTVLPFIDLPERAELFTGESTMVVEHQVVTELRASSAGMDSYTVGGEQVPAILLTPYACALSLFTGGTAQTEAKDETGLHALRVQWQQQVVFRKAGILLLGFFFVVLLVNALAFVRLSMTNQDLSENQGANQKTLQELTQLKEEVNKSQAFVKSAGWMKQTPLWYYADRLAASIPAEINLTRLDVCPMDEKKKKDERKTIFNYSVITVSGVCPKPVVLNEWLAGIKKLEWVRDVNDQVYQYRDREKTGYFDFKIVIRED